MDFQLKSFAIWNFHGNGISVKIPCSLEKFLVDVIFLIQQSYFLLELIVRKEKVLYCCHILAHLNDHVLSRGFPVEKVHSDELLKWNLYKNISCYYYCYFNFTLLDTGSCNLKGTRCGKFIRIKPRVFIQEIFCASTINLEYWFQEFTLRVCLVPIELEA